MSATAPFRDRAAARAFLGALAGKGDALWPLAEAGLALSALRRDESAALDAERAHLDDIAARMADQAVSAGSTALGRAGALGRVLFGHFAYQGDAETYDDLANADMASVIARRRGLPVALGILYIHAARAAGWRASGLGLPGHFLLRVEGAEDRAIIDPFSGGAVLGPSELRALLPPAEARQGLNPATYKPVSDRAVLMRLQSNIILRRQRAGDSSGVADALEETLLFAPGESELWHRKAEAELARGHLAETRAALAQVVRLTPDPQRRAEAQRMYDALTRRLN